jgi:hypothetical protein
MVAHGRYHSNFCRPLQLFAEENSKIKIVALSLLPYVVGRVIPSPIYQTRVYLLKLLEEEVKGLNWEIT